MILGRENEGSVGNFWDSSFMEKDALNEDYETLFGALADLQFCRTRKDLRTFFADSASPLFAAAAPQGKGKPILDPASNFEGIPGISTSDNPLIQEYLKTDSLANTMLNHTSPLPLPFGSPGWIYQNLLPALLQKIITVMVREELAKSNSVVQALLHSPAGIALVDEDMRLLTCNQSFTKLFQLSSRDVLPEEFSKVMKRKNTNGGGDEHQGVELSYFSLPQGNFKLTYFELYPYGTDGEIFWLVRIHPSADPFTKSNLLREKAGLTWREMEICCLIHDGLGRQEIAERLFISAHTVKTHLKKIHKKLRVRSRTQLVAYLNQHSGENYERQFS